MQRKCTRKQMESNYMIGLTLSIHILLQAQIIAGLALHITCSFMKERMCVY